ncbi:hypothetical protein SEA_WATERT_71 [Microbacterium phage WaterT]|nr:hypothetical protein SEA_WATERT_71 [Microbacterium phage WaterT]QOC59393.1 membrane protein [Microbacterium phage Lifes]
MDVTPIVVWMVIWGVMIFASVPILGVVGLGLGFLAGIFTDSEDVTGPIGAITGYISGAALAVFSIIQVILHIIALVQALN